MGNVGPIKGRIERTSVVNDSKVPTIPLWTLIGMEFKRGPCWLGLLTRTLGVDDTTLFDNLHRMVGECLISPIGTTNRAHLGGPPSKPYVLAKGICFGTFSGAIQIPPVTRILHSDTFVMVRGGTLIPTLALFTSN